MAGSERASAIAVALTFPPRLAQTICLCARRFPAAAEAGTTKTTALPTHSANISAFASFLPSFLPSFLSVSPSLRPSSRMAERSDFPTMNAYSLYLESSSLIRSEGEGERDEPRSEGDGVCGGAAGFGSAAVFVGVGSDACAVRHHVRDVRLLVRRVEEVRHGAGREDAHVRPAVGF